LALDPQSVEAQSRLATALAARVLDNMTHMAAADILRAERLAGRALGDGDAERQMLVEIAIAAELPLHERKPGVASEPVSEPKIPC